MSNVLHCWDTPITNLINLFKNIIYKKISVSNDITIISIMNLPCYNNSFLVKQSINSNFKLLVPDDALNVSSNDWTNILKIKCLVNVLPKVKTKYVLVLDGKDTVLVNDLDDEFITNFNNTKCDLIFNKQIIKYPNIEFDGEKEFNYINAGVCFGYTDFVYEFYKECEELSSQETYISEYTNKPSEQYIVRKVAAKTKLNVGIDEHYILFSTRECFGQCSEYLNTNYKDE